MRIERRPSINEVVQDKDVVDQLRELIEQIARGNHTHPLGRHDREVVALGQLHRLEQLVKSLLAHSRLSPLLSGSWTRGGTVPRNIQSGRQASNGNELALPGSLVRNSRMREIGMPYLASVLALSFQIRWGARRPDEPTSVRSAHATTLRGKLGV